MDDVLADVLTATRIDSTVFCRKRFLAPWGLRFNPDSQAGFHIVLGGQVWLRTESMVQPMALQQGDVVLLPHGAGHSLASDLNSPLYTYAELAERSDSPVVDDMPRASAEPKGLVSMSSPTRVNADTACIMYGTYRFDRDASHPLLALLPAVIHIPGADDGQLPAPLQPVLSLLAEEHGRAESGSTAVVTRLVDILFIYIVRNWASRQHCATAGWLAALRDGQIGRALMVMHRQPHRDWSVNELAQEVAMSRSSFVRRFSRLVGEPPLSYLTRWRMDIAAKLLRETELPMAQIAERVGYRSQYAFNRAFQRTRGTPPGRYRDHIRDAQAA